MQSLGNHEFDDGNKGLVPFLKNINFPIICSNINLTNVPEMQQYIKPSVKVERSGHTIGIIGYLTTETVVCIYKLIETRGPIIYFIEGRSPSRH